MMWISGKYRRRKKGSRLKQWRDLQSDSNKEEKRKEITCQDISISGKPLSFKRELVCKQL